MKYRFALIPNLVPSYISYFVHYLGRYFVLFFVFVFFNFNFYTFTLTTDLAIAQNRDSKISTKIPVAQMLDVPFDEWTQTIVASLFEDPSRGPSEIPPTNVPNVSRTMDISLDPSSKLSLPATVLKAFLSDLKLRSLNNWDDVKSYASFLIQQRRIFRDLFAKRAMNNTTSSQDNLVHYRRTLFLMEWMTEELLFLSYKKFEDSKSGKSIAIKDFTITFNNAHRYAHHKGHQTSDDLGPYSDVDLSNTPLLNSNHYHARSGDMLLSKASGNGSSALISLVMQSPHLFSHSTPLFVSPRPPRLISPEAFIEDGVKLRDLTKDYIENSKTRLFIYRFSSSQEQDFQKINDQMESFLRRMNQRANGQPEQIAAFKYDFSMNPLTAVDSFFCSGVGFEIYPHDNPNDLRNPYPSRLWSSFGTGARTFLMNQMNINSDKIPAPGDLELHPYFVPVGFQLDLSKLEFERIDSAIVDTLFYYLDTHQNAKTQLEKIFQSLGDEPLNPSEILNWINTDDSIDANTKKTWTAYLAKIPPNISPKQLVFFFVLDELLVPQMRKAMLQKTHQLEKTGVKGGNPYFIGPQELRSLALSLFINQANSSANKQGWEMMKEHMKNSELGNLIEHYLKKKEPNTSPIRTGSMD